MASDRAQLPTRRARAGADPSTLTALGKHFRGLPDEIAAGKVFPSDRLIRYLAVIAMRELAGTKKRDAKLQWYYALESVVKLEVRLRQAERTGALAVEQLDEIMCAARHRLAEKSDGHR